MTDGVYDRIGGPAVVLENGTKIWKEKGVTHRCDGGPAYIDKYNNVEMWYVRGKRHREGDLPAVLHLRTGKREYWENNERHRIGNPAVWCPGAIKEEWWERNERHRGEGKPAVTHWDGSTEHWQRGVKIFDNTHAVKISNATKSPKRQRKS